MRRTKRTRREQLMWLRGQQAARLFALSHVAEAHGRGATAARDYIKEVMQGFRIIVGKEEGA